MAVISNIEEKRGLIVIEADGQRLCAIKRAFFKQLPLQIGDAIDEDQYLDRLAQLQLNPCYEAALTILDFSMRATGEMRKKLKLKGFLEPAIDATIARLLESRLLNDDDYAERVVEQAQRKPVGRYALKRKLRAKGVDEESVEAALEQISDADQVRGAIALAEKLGKKHQDLPKREAKAKLSAALSRRGFSWDSISAALAHHFDDDEWS